MMSSGSHKDLLKAVNSYVALNVFPLPDELLEVIQSYLDKHSPIEDSESQRLQDELVGIYQKDVKDKPSRYLSFMSMLRQLRPAITHSTRLLQWWEILVLPVLDHITIEKGLAAETRGILLEILVYDTDEGDVTDAMRTSATLSERLLEIWLKPGKTAFKLDPAAHFLEHQIQHVLVEFGKKRPKVFLMAIDKFFVTREHRLQVLSLLCEFIHHGPPHLHQLLQTPLLADLIRSLQIDTSTTVISLGLTALIMFLPHIPNSIAPHLPSLFKIYSRVLFWDRELAVPFDESNHHTSDNHVDGVSDNSRWGKLPYSPQFDSDTVPELLHYFTFLYGLYPINFMSYIRKPGRYLRHANLPDAEEIDVQPMEIRQRSEQFRQLHLLHPNFYNMTIESEIKNKERWINSEAADVVAACVALRGPNISSLPPIRNLSGISRNRQQNCDVPDRPLLEDSVDLAKLRSESDAMDGQDSGWRNTTTTTVVSPDPRHSLKQLPYSQTTRMYDDSPVLGPQDERVDSPTMPPQLLTDSQDEHRGSPPPRNSLYESANESEVSMGSNLQIQEPLLVNSYLQSLAQHQKTTVTSTGVLPPEETSISSLRREIILLKNDLSFERYLKQQHLSHIGQLRRKHFREATVEAETQHLINSNKGLKNKLEDAKCTALQMKKESEKSRTHSKRWEAQLTAKLRALREEQKKSTTEIENLGRDLSSARDNCLQLRQLVAASEAKELTARLKLQSMEVTVQENSKLRAEVEKLTATVQRYEVTEAENKRSRATEVLAISKAEKLEMKARAREAEISKARVAVDREIRNLTMRLEEATQSKHDTPPKGWQSMLDDALAASRSKLNESQRAHAHLLRKFTNLQGQYLALQSTRDPDEPLHSFGDGRSRQDGEHSYPFSAPDHLRMRSRGVSDPNSMERNQHCLTPTSESGSITIRSAPKPDLPSFHRDARPASQNDYRSPSQRLSGAEQPLHATRHVRSGSADESHYEDKDPKIKPQSDIRFYGRGGVQNIGKKDKEKKDKRKDDLDKKDKKTVGFRGLRGLT